MAQNICHGLDYIVDDNPLKHGLYTPGMNIPIYSPDKLKGEPEQCLVVPLSWNFFDEIRSRVLVSRSSCKDLFVRYFPALEVDE